MKTHRRIRQIIHDADLDQIQLSKMLGRSKRYIAMLFRDKREVSKELALAIEALTGYSHKWILTGKGALTADELPEGLHFNERQLLKLFRTYPRALQEALLQLMTVMLK